MLTEKDIKKIIDESRKEDLPAGVRLLLLTIDKNPHVQKELASAYNDELFFQEEMKNMRDFR